MGNRNLVIVGAIVILAVVGFVLLQNQATTPPPTTSPQATATPTQTIQAQKEKTVTLDEQNNSGQSGTADLREVGEKVLVTITMEGTPSADSQPAHIHMGACPNVGDVKYPLTSIKDGSSETTLDVTMAQLLSELPLAINVHKSAAQIKVYTACGDLKE